MHIGILQTGHVAEALVKEHGDYDQIFMEFLAGRGLRFTNFAVVDGVFPIGVDACDGWLITGSKHGAYEDHPWIPPLEEFIRAAHARQIPLVGICFGHQIIAQALGGRVEKFSGGWAVGRTEYDFAGRGAVALNAWHQDQVTALPEGAEVIASNEFCANAAFTLGQHVLTMQPHPEIRAPYLRGLLEVRGRGVVPDALLAEGLAQIDQPVDEAPMAAMIADFFLSAKVTA
ncbi:GMP synthase [Candidatus Rhodobacter oscarellae]|uniref:GMP synthase n=1 Tax=Candidatus Rhodobacter oscarellae TaxID=1675527 RepID=A0A0J9EDU9_9RHOB|nr:type 1 glutamine amidotransferase [Candidatus Rhodobacter lobularis]KMW60801.1 GMP synthase [Candidatus Rhodobacter lobularis]